LRFSRKKSKFLGDSQFSNSDTSTQLCSSFCIGSDDVGECKCLPTEFGDECFTCPAGTVFSDSESTLCIDLDECSSDDDECQAGQTCSNIFGGYECIDDEPGNILYLL